jgi:hypothetical protein
MRARLNIVIPKRSEESLYLFKPRQKSRAFGVPSNFAGRGVC